MRSKTGLLAILAIFSLLSACASQGPVTKTGFTMPDGERGTIVAHNQRVPDWMLARSGLKLNFVVRGDVSDKQLAAVAETERACRIYTGVVRPNNLVAVLSSGILYAGAGAIGLGLGAQAFTGAVANQYARYGAWASGLSGLANGTITLGGKTYTFENCGREVLGLFPEYGVHIIQKSP